MSAAPCRAKGPPARAVPRLRRPAAVVLLLATLLLPAPAPADDDGDVPHDLLLTVAARRALLADRDLAHLALGVSVRHGLATLWGSSPSAGLTAQAVERLRHVPGLNAVRSEVLPASRAEAAPDPGERGEPEPALPEVSRRAPGALASQADPPGRAPGLPVSASSAPGGSPDSAVSLSAPVTEAEPRPTAARPPPAQLLRPIARPTPTAMTNAPDLAAAVEQLRRGDDRFRQFRPEVQGRAVVLRGTVSRGEDLTAFARALSRLPGVERVVVDQVQVGPRP